MPHTAPEGMIPVADYARQHGMTADEAVQRIRDGELQGRKVGDDWFALADQAPEGAGATGARAYTFQGRGQPAAGVQQVVVIDIQMKFGSMVAFMIKWAIASIPALIVLILLGMLASAIIGALTVGIR